MSNRQAWWENEKSDPWALTTNWVDNYIEPVNEFEDCVNDKLRWKQLFLQYRSFYENYKLKIKNNDSYFFTMLFGIRDPLDGICQI